MLALAACLPAFSAGEYRTFTGKDGREIQAKIIKVDSRSDKVTVERDNRRRITVPATIFSDADQTYIKEWVAAQDFMSSSKLKVSVEKEKGKTGSDKSQTKRPKPPCHYEIVLNNRSGNNFDDIRIEYCTYMNKESLKGGTDELSVGCGQIDQVKFVQGRFSAKTPFIKLYRYYTAHYEVSYDSSGYPVSDTSYNKVAEDNLEGIRVRISYRAPSGTVFTREICEPDSIANKYGWKNPDGHMTAASGGTGNTTSNTSDGSPKTPGLPKFSYHDTNGDGRVTLEEFLEVRKERAANYIERNVKKYFKRLDVNSDGYLTPDEMG